MCRYISSNEYLDNVGKFYLPNKKRAKNRIFFDKEYGKIVMNHFSTGLGITYSSFEGIFDEDTIIEGLNIDDFSFLCFNTGNSILWEDSYQKRKLDFDSNFCLHGSLNCGCKSNGFYSKNKNYICHYITFDNNLFKELLEEKEEFRNLKPFFQTDSFKVNFNNKITKYQKNLLGELTKISLLQGKLQELFLESKLMDLIYTTINEVKSIDDKKEIYLNSQDIESLQRAKTILINNMINPPSLKELAYKSAINEFKLKKGFKQLFGNTVYGFLQEHRLNEAKKLLETDEINIGEASSLVGYKSISHFSKIFKEYFGTTPIQIKKESRKYYC